MIYLSSSIPSPNYVNIENMYFLVDDDQSSSLVLDLRHTSGGVGLHSGCSRK